MWNRATGLSLLSLATILAGGAKGDDSDRFFADGRIVRLKIEAAPAEVEILKKEQRQYARIILKEEGGDVFDPVAVKLKGAAGSSRPWHERPALTINMSKFRKGKSFHGLDKWHLNNSVQDESCLNELLCAEIFKAAKIPAPRVTHARVWLNGRDVGLYVLKEGFDKTFLRRHFGNARGNLYDGGFVQDVDADLEKDEGDDSEDRRDLKALANAAREDDPKKRWSEIPKHLDFEAFLSFMIVERMTGHWDGYANNANNYRLYFDPSRGNKAYFLPHGMDQMFGDPGASMLDHPRPLLSRAVMEHDPWRLQYRKRMKELLPLLDPPDRWLELIDAVAKRIEPALKEFDKNAAKAYPDVVKGFRERFVARVEHLKREANAPDPAPLTVGKEGFTRIDDWRPAPEHEDAKLEKLDAMKSGVGREAYRIQVGKKEGGGASWRRTILLPRGRYVLTASCKLKEVKPLEPGPESGVTFRVDYGSRSAKLEGTTDLKTLQCEIEVKEDRRQVEIVAEVRAKSGEAWFDAAAFRISSKAEGKK
jgi:spore coat protein H